MRSRTENVNGLCCFYAIQSAKICLDENARAFLGSAGMNFPRGTLVEPKFRDLLTTD